MTDEELRELQARVFDPDGWLNREVVELIGREAVRRAIAEHKAAGHSIYYADPAYPGMVVEERADGRRFLMDEDENGHAKIIGEIPPS